MEHNSKLHQLASHNDDIKRLLEKGYALSINNNYLIVRDVPYLDDKGDCKIGAIVSKFVDIDSDKIKPGDHQVFFCGSHPYNSDGSKIANLGGGARALDLGSNDLQVQRCFSSKPVDQNGRLRPYIDHFEKIEHYVSMFSGPAIQKHPQITPKPLTFNRYDDIGESVFKYRDTLTSRAEINDLSQKFKEDTVAVIGLGGTGSYILDFLVKTPVREIRGFDADFFYVHNAYRSPGRLINDELGKPKATIYQARYENFRTRLVLKPLYVDKSSSRELDGVSFAFVCVDKGESRKNIFSLLTEMKIPFIDVGMGLDRDNGPIEGMARVTYYPVDTAQALIEKDLCPMADYPDDEYKINIQTSEINALNASLAVIKYKQIRGFYCDENLDYNILFDINDSRIVGENEL